MSLNKGLEWPYSKFVMNQLKCWKLVKKWSWSKKIWINSIFSLNRTMPHIWINLSQLLESGQSYIWINSNEHKQKWFLEHFHESNSFELDQPIYEPVHLNWIKLFTTRFHQTEAKNKFWRVLWMDSPIPLNRFN